jgi:hypothetical protein
MRNCEVNLRWATPRGFRPGNGHAVSGRHEPPAAAAARAAPGLPGTVALYDDLGMTTRPTAIGFVILRSGSVADVPKSIKSYRFGVP